MRIVLVLAVLGLACTAGPALAGDPPPPENRVICVTVDHPATDRPSPEVCVPKPV